MVSQRSEKIQQKNQSLIYYFLCFALLADSNENSKCSLSIVGPFGEMYSMKFIARWDLWQMIEMRGERTGGSGIGVDRVHAHDACVGGRNEILINLLFIVLLKLFAQWSEYVTEHCRQRLSERRTSAVYYTSADIKNSFNRDSIFVNMRWSFFA